MSQSDQSLDEVPPGRSRFEPLALAASLAAVTVTVLLCYALVAGAEGWGGLPWPLGFGHLVAALVVLWIVLAVTGVACGFITLVLPNQRRVTPAVALALGVSSLAVVPVVAAGSLWTWVGPHHPSDAKLTRRFRQHEAQFDQAIAAYKASGSVERLRSLGIDADAAGGDPDHGPILLTVSSWGMVPSGSAKGYAYSEAPLQPVTESETSGFSGDMPDEIVYRHIDGPWYVFYQWW